MLDLVNCKVVNFDDLRILPKSGNLMTNRICLNEKEYSDFVVKMLWEHGFHHIASKCTTMQNSWLMSGTTTRLNNFIAM